MDLIKRLRRPPHRRWPSSPRRPSASSAATAPRPSSRTSRATISVYEGSDVRVLGVPVGTVTRVEPTGTDVTVTMAYDDDVKLPADAKAVIIAPSVVGDRYVQLTPAYSGRATC